MFYNLVEDKVNIGDMSLDYISFGKGNKNLIVIQGLNVRDVKGAGVSIALMYKMFAKDYRIKRVVGSWVECAKNHDHITINRETFTLMYTDKYLRKYRLLMPLLIKLVKPRDFKRFELLAASMLEFDCYDRLNEIKCPVLVLGGALDKIITGDASVEIADKVGFFLSMKYIAC